MKTIDRTAKKTVVNVGVAEDAHTLLGTLAGQRGMTNGEMVARLIRWLGGLESSEQAIVLDQISRGDVPAIAAMVVLRTPGQQPEAVERAAQVVEDAVRQVQRREVRKGKAG